MRPRPPPSLGPLSASQPDAAPALHAGHLKKSMREEATRITKRVQQLEKEQEQDRKNGKTGSSGSMKPDPGAVDPGRPERVTHSPEPLDPEQQQDESPFGLDGVWNLHGERPPPSSLAGRKDTVRSPLSLFSPLSTLLLELTMMLSTCRPKRASSPRSSTSTTRACTASRSGPRCARSLLRRPLTSPPDSSSYARRSRTMLARSHKAPPTEAGGARRRRLRPTRRATPSAGVQLCASCLQP